MNIFAASYFNSTKSHAGAAAELAVHREHSISILKLEDWWVLQRRHTAGVHGVKDGIAFKHRKKD